MTDPVKLKANLGPVIFLGGVNAMPMMYAIELRKRGIPVIYFVDRPKSDTLSRPENHYKEIGFPYPDWIIEKTLPTQIFLPIFRRIFAHWINITLTKANPQKPQAIILNGFFCSLAPFLQKDIPKIFLPGGSDLDSWADMEGAAKLSKTFAKRSIFRYLPKFISQPMIKSIVEKQFLGATHCNKVLYFPRGFNPAGDRVLNKLELAGVNIHARYDISFEPLKNEPRGYKRHDSGRLVIFSGVRFLFKTFPDGNREYNKGNDVIIRGLAQYYQANKNTEIHFVEKGEDVVEAKRMCDELGLTEAVTWHQQMKFTELLQLYRNADVCFDQLGEHWIGAIGFYALWLGKPLIANDKRAIESGVWKANAPILSASTVEEVSYQLTRAALPEYRAHIAEEAMAFAESSLGPEKVLNEVFQFHQ